MVEPFAVVDDTGQVMIVTRTNGSARALTYKTRRGATRAAERHGGWVVDLREPKTSRMAFKPLTGQQTYFVDSQSRRRLPRHRESRTYAFVVGDLEGYMQVGLYEDGAPGELFLTLSKQGSIIAGLADVFSISTSIALQYGAPLEVLCAKFTDVKFGPDAYVVTNDPEIPQVRSIVDYIFRRLAIDFLTVDQRARVGV